MDGKTEHRELPHPAAHPDQHGSIPMTDDRKPDRCVRHDCRRALAESRAEVERLREAASRVLDHVQGAQPTSGWLRDNDASRTALTELRAALSLELTP